VYRTTPYQSFKKAYSVDREREFLSVSSHLAS
jgi:hypothetical protein